MHVQPSSFETEEGQRIACVFFERAIKVFIQLRRLESKVRSRDREKEKLKSYENCQAGYIFQISARI